MFSEMLALLPKIRSGISKLAGVSSDVGGIAGTGQNLFQMFRGSNEKSGSEMGDFARDYYGSAFPGTTPWEQLGSSNPGGSIESARIGADNALKVKGAELSTQMRIAKMNNDTQKEVAKINTGPASQRVDAEVDKLVAEGEKLRKTMDIGSLRSWFEKSVLEIGIDNTFAGLIWKHIIRDFNKDEDNKKLFSPAYRPKVESTPKKNVDIEVYPVK